MHGSRTAETRARLCSPKRGPGGVWQRREGAAPAVTLESKLRALRETTAEGSPERRRAEAAFVVDALPFLTSICRWYRGPDLMDEDLMAEARLAFVEAMREWKPGGRPFDTFARWGVRFALAKMLRASRMIRGRGRDGLLSGTTSVLHGLDASRKGAQTGGVASAELLSILTDMDGDARIQDYAEDIEREAGVADLRDAVSELPAEDQAAVAAWLANSHGRALPARIRDKLREMVG